MNEKIKELAEQAWKEILDETNIEGDLSTMFSACEVVAFEQKFAELLIQKCITCVKYTDKDHIFTAHDAGVVGAAHDRAIKAIRKHFGVEE